MTEPRIFMARSFSSRMIPALPDDLMAVVDKTGLRWTRTPGSSINPNCFAPDDPLNDHRQPNLLSWHQLLVGCGPVSEAA